MLPNIDRILIQAKLTLSVFAERYGSGFTAILAPIVEHAAWIERQLTGEDSAACEMQVYLGQAGNRFPIGHADTPVVALQKLDEVLGLVGNTQAQIDAWRDAVQASYDSMFDAEKRYARSPWFIASAKDAGELALVD